MEHSIEPLLEVDEQFSKGSLDLKTSVFHCRQTLSGQISLTQRSEPRKALISGRSKTRCQMCVSLGNSEIYSLKMPLQCSMSSQMMKSTTVTQPRQAPPDLAHFQYSISWLRIILYHLPCISYISFLGLFLFSTTTDSRLWIRSLPHRNPSTTSMSYAFLPSISSRPDFRATYSVMGQDWVTTRRPSVRKGSQTKSQLAVNSSLQFFQVQGLKSRFSQGILRYSQTMRGMLAVPRQGQDATTSLSCQLSMNLR